MLNCNVNKNTMIIATSILLCLSWMMGFVHGGEPGILSRGSSSSSLYNDNVTTASTNTNNNSLRSPSAPSSSSHYLGTKDDNDFNDLKEVVLYLSQQMKDNTIRMKTLEEKVQVQDNIITNLQTQIKKESKKGASNTAGSFDADTDAAAASFLHRYLQSNDSGCLPKFVQTSFGPRCDFNSVTRFQNEVFFNDNVVFNEHVEFDSDANCMPTFNSTSNMCRFNNNFTFDEGNIIFNHSVNFNTNVTEFNNTVIFNENTTVKLENDVDFDDRGQVNVNKPIRFSEDVTIRNTRSDRDIQFKVEENVKIEFDTKRDFEIHSDQTIFTEDILIANEDHDIEFKLDDKVKVKFYQDHTFEVDTYTTFYKDVEMKRSLEVDRDMRVHKRTRVKDLELYGYLWVDGETRLDGVLKANNGVTVKGDTGVHIESGGLEISKDGAHIVGTTDLDGTFKLRGNGLTSGGSFSVDGKVTANYVVIDNSNNNGWPSRNLQQNGHPSPTNAPTSTPLLIVKGDTDIDGTLKAKKIRSNDINGGNNNNNDIDMNEIVNEIKIQLRDETIFVGDIVIVNNLNQEEPVMTESRMLDLMDSGSANLKVKSITANSASIGGTDYPLTSDEIVNLLENSEIPFPSITSQDVVKLLENQNLNLKTLVANTATIGNQFYPHTDDNDNSSDDDADNVPVPPSLTIDDIVKELKTYSKPVTIPVLNSVDLAVISTVIKDNVGRLVTVPGAMKFNGETVATTKDLDDLEETISNTVAENNKYSDDEGDDPRSITTDEIVAALDGAKIRVSSVEATSSMSIGMFPVTTIEDVNSIVTKAIDNYKSEETSSSECTCDRTDIEEVVSTEYVQGKIDNGYIKSLGFITNDELDCTCSEDDFRNAFSSDYINGIVSESSSCTCSEDDIKTAIDSDFIKDMNFITAEDLPKESDCVCEIDESQIKDIITGEYIADNCPSCGGDD